MQRRVVIEHLAEVAQIEGDAAIRAGHEVLGLALSRLARRACR
jgi:hypothetical protein